MANKACQSTADIWIPVRSGHGCDSGKVETDLRFLVQQRLRDGHAAAGVKHVHHGTCTRQLQHVVRSTLQSTPCEEETYVASIANLKTMDMRAPL